MESDFPTQLKQKNERGVSLEKLVAIIDVMPEYGQRLAAYLNNSRTFPYRAVVFSSADEAESYIKNNGVYAVLAAEELEKDVLDVVVGTGVKLFWLRERKDAYKGSSMYRYGSAKDIERGLTETKEREKRIPVIGFFSPAGGTEAELLSRKIAEGLGKKGKVLYFSMFPFGIYGRECEDGLSEAVYFIRQPEGELKLRLRRLLQCGEYMDSIGPVRWYTDLSSVTKTDMESFFRSGLWETQYQAFFVAVGQFDTVGRNVLGCCDNVLVPVWETKEGRRIQEEFRRQIKESGETKLYSGILEFSVEESLGALPEEAVAAAVNKGVEAIAGDYGRDSQNDPGAIGFVRGADG